MRGASLFSAALLILCSFTVNAEDESENFYRSTLTGAIVGAMYNSANYAVKMGGRASNILSIHDLNSISSRGNARWWVRIDKPHGKVQYHHINVNPKITGVPDPHIPISEATAEWAGMAGKGLDVVNKAAPFLMAYTVASDAFDVYDGYRNGNIKGAKDKVVEKVATYAGASYGASAGATLGTCIFPGIGTMLGSMVGGAIGGQLGSGVADVLKAPGTIDLASSPPKAIH